MNPSFPKSDAVVTKQGVLRSPGKEIKMPRSRERQRANRRRKYEEMLKRKDECGVTDLTPHDAVRHIIMSDRAKAYYLDRSTKS